MVIMNYPIATIMLHIFYRNYRVNFNNRGHVFTERQKWQIEVFSPLSSWHSVDVHI